MQDRDGATTLATRFGRAHLPIVAANEDAEEIDCGDVAVVARELIEAAVAALDSVDLERVRTDDA